MAACAPTHQQSPGTRGKQGDGKGPERKRRGEPRSQAGDIAHGLERMPGLQGYPHNPDHQCATAEKQQGEPIDQRCQTAPQRGERKRSQRGPCRERQQKHSVRRRRGDDGCHSDRDEP